MQAGVVDGCRIGRQNGRLNRRPAGVRKTPIKRNVKDIMEIQINRLRFQRIGESVERLLHQKLQFSKNFDSAIDRPLGYNASGPVEEEWDIIQEFDVSGELYVRW